MSERYPLINEVIDVDNVPEFDNFYLDMNGIIHNCSHGNTGGQKQASEEHMWLDVFKYVSGLVYRINPKKLVYLAVDGVAPRAKMNQQRSRRFRAAHDARESREKNEKMNGESKKDEKPAFDSNCITPGTAFMERLVHHLEFFVQKKLAEDPLWRDLQVVISGPDVPGEGEHKIMDYIRSVKSQPGYNPNTQHCLYGLDADLIMLSLASHEPYFALLREEIDFSFSRTKSKESRSMIKPDKFQLLHVGLLREYLRIDFFGDQYLDDVRAGNANIVGPESEPERVIDDFIFFCFLVGNDFLPHLPFSEIGEGGLNKLFGCYKQMVTGTSPRPFLVHSDGRVNFHVLFQFLQNYVVLEREMVAEMIENDNWKIGKTRICNAAIGDPMAAIELYTNPESLASSDEEWKQQQTNIAKKDIRRFGKPQNVDEAIDNYNQIKLGIVNDDEKAKHVYSYLEGLQWVFYYYFKGPQSWDWYFPYHYSPFASEVVEVLATRYNEGKNLEINFTNGKPFLPFQQLMAVLPPASGRNFLPATLYNLMVAPQSPIRTFYPEEFQIDIDGVKVPWGGVTIIPFVDEVKLIRAIDEAIATHGIPPEDARRNREGVAKIFGRNLEHGDKNILKISEIKSSLPTLLKDIDKCKLVMAPFVHEAIPDNVDIFPHWVIQGYSHMVHKDFPSLFKFMDRFDVSYYVGSGIRVFNSISKKESLMIQLTVRHDQFLSLEEIKSGKLISFNFPFYSKKLNLLSVAVPEKKIRIVKGKETIDTDWNLSRQEYDVDYLCGKLEESGLKIEVMPENGIDDVKIFYSQPVIELYDKATANGDTVKCLAAIAMLRSTTPVVSRTVSNVVSLRESHVEESPPPSEPLVNLSLNIRNEMVFGHKFERDDAGRYFFPSLPSIAVTDAIRTGIEEILKLSSSVKYNQWMTIWDVSQQLGHRVSPDFVWCMFGEVWIRFGKFQEEIGMNLWSYSSHGEPHCVPGYSKFIGQSRRWKKWDNPDTREWVFSSLAVKALSDYMRDQPELISEVRETVPNSSESQMNGGITIQGRRLFSRFSTPRGVGQIAGGGRDDWVSEYHLGKIVSYVNSKQFKTLNICNYQYDHVLSGFVGMIEKFIDRMNVEGNRISHHFEEEKNLYPFTLESLRSTSKFSAPENIQLGQRGIYVKQRGVVEVGSWGTVIGIYGVGRDQRIDVLLDEQSLNASSLNGTCPELRGIRIIATDWRTFPNQFRRPVAKDAEVSKMKNKILAELIVENDRERAAMADPKHAILSMLGVKVSSAPVSVEPPKTGTKISVNQLFQSGAPPPILGSSPSSSSAPAARRLQPPTVIMHRDVVAQLNSSKPPTPPPATEKQPEIPEFLLSKLRKQ